MNEKTNNTEKEQSENIFANKEIPHGEKRMDQKLEDSFRSVRVAKEIENLADANIEYIDDVDVHYAIKNSGSYQTSYNDGSDSKLYVSSVEQAIIWKMEIAGQISDGIWENDRKVLNSGWEKYAYADVIVDDMISRPRFECEGKVETLLFTDRMYTDELNGRMIFYVRMIENRDYDANDLWDDLFELEKALNNASKE